MKPLVLNQIIKHYAGTTAVDNLSLEVEAGEIYGLLGANGAGKTTTMRMVLGLIYPDEGEILYNGRPYRTELQHKMGYLPEERGLYPKIKISDQLVYLGQLRGMTHKDAVQSLKKWLERFDAMEYLDKRIEELSKGNQQKMGFIAAVIHHPSILILDEAFSGLDPVNVEMLKEVIQELRDEGTAILFSTHRMEHVEELCRNMTILRRSKPVLQGNLREIKHTYPREKVVLRTANPLVGLQDIAGVTNVEPQDENGRYLIHINEEEATQQILQLAMQQGSVEQFEIKEPTLNEIFIKVVGNNE
ncbi:ABC-2 type transport system ATP-binding protein [Paenibacillus sp. SORGH_AS306]|uniref:ABC transporter ATP-binding protein n=1 Tax=unclassified Paenibacillus TaxID=185978 RepID=UPI002788BBC6|nr:MULTISPECIES: ATP-binding cassette domain-containing protein [unclassified Paenibacillus]MDQ1237060.1 ABC-2 type transport system ATP-binding protein [Paenibacillus sp. SORGH_AS_0306]MDR6109420.1 ABC-2 type transport system ATP-binding protein [Paenibacillus sp. SORGH_AS_0338]